MSREVMVELCISRAHAGKDKSLARNSHFLARLARRESADRHKTVHQRIARRERGLPLGGKLVAGIIVMGGATGRLYEARRRLGPQLQLNLRILRSCSALAGPEPRNG
jgi:hypothetical protein